VPGDLSVVGYDNSHIASLTSVALTTVAQDAPTLAASALEVALRQAESSPDRLPPSEVVVPPGLVVRETTAPLPQR
jgi:DNA-binding LacI/PurR family transcriptional regulator